MQNHDGGPAPATKNVSHLVKTTRKYCACHTKDFSTHFETCWNVTKYHACHAKRGYATFETSKSDCFCGQTVANGCGRLRTVANGCGRLRAVAQRLAYTPSTPKPQSEFGKGHEMHPDCGKPVNKIDLAVLGLAACYVWSSYVSLAPASISQNVMAVFVGCRTMAFPAVLCKRFSLENKIWQTRSKTITSWKLSRRPELMEIQK